MDDSLPAVVSEPFPVFLVAHRYLLYDVNTVTYARREHHILGTLIGGLPQAPQQNVFLGIPLQLTPEEVRLLVEKKAAYIVDDVAAHKQGFLNNGIGQDEQRAFRASLDRMGTDASRRQARIAADKKEVALKKIADKTAAKTENWNDIPDDMFSARTDKKKTKKPAARAAIPTSGSAVPGGPPASLPPPPSATSTTSDDTLFDGANPSTEGNILPLAADPSKITPTTSHPPLTSRPPDTPSSLPIVPTSYPLFRHMHENGYFLAPGLRFGCQYMAYPGDPLRYHSHFLCNGLDWDQEFDLLDLVGGGRLGTGVKKSYLLGGETPRVTGQTGEVGQNKSEKKDNVRVFCVEWGGM